MSKPNGLKSESKAAPRRSFLLRLWCSDGQGETGWQAALEDPYTGERVGFADLEHLFNYLIELTEAGGYRVQANGTRSTQK